MARAALREPAPLVTLALSLTVENVDSIGFRRPQLCPVLGKLIGEVGVCNLELSVVTDAFAAPGPHGQCLCALIFGITSVNQMKTFRIPTVNRRRIGFGAREPIGHEVENNVHDDN
jgi:hypothetical protein